MNAPHSNLALPRLSRRAESLGTENAFVVLAEVNESSYPEDDEARHLLHIGATRAAHQLWVLASDKPSLLVPEELRAKGY